MSTYECPWMFKGKEFESEDIPKGKGIVFVYLITDLDNGKKYIGQKMFFGKKPVTKNKITKKVTCESDWKNYFSSSETIKEKVKEHGSSIIKREILYICYSKGQANYLETKLQFELNCLEDQTIWYNGIVNLRCHWSHIKMDKLIDKDDNLISSLYLEYRPTF